MLVKATVLLALANTLISAVSALPVLETNAQRMARGLTPNPPVHLARRATAVWGRYYFINDPPFSLMLEHFDQPLSALNPHLGRPPGKYQRLEGDRLEVYSYVDQLHWQD